MSVYSREDACQAAKSLKGKRFLCNDAPPHLPLDGCTAVKCRCIYRHHADRRSSDGERRGIASGTAILQGHGSVNRRLGIGRRDIDKNGGVSWT